MISFFFSLSRVRRLARGWPPPLSGLIPFFRPLSDPSFLTYSARLGSFSALGLPQFSLAIETVLFAAPLYTSSGSSPLNTFSFPAFGCLL